jgi:hypothetical protein
LFLIADEYAVLACLTVEDLNGYPKILVAIGIGRAVDADKRSEFLSRMSAISSRATPNMPLVRKPFGPSSENPPAAPHRLRSLASL